MKKGFTLIELLVVIAIIGILASVVAVGMSGARDRARDSKLKENLHQISNLATLINEDDSSYAGLCTSTSAVNSDHPKQGTSLGILQSDIDSLNATTVCCTSTAAYCVSVELLSSGAGYFCVDSAGQATTTASNTCTTTDPGC